MTHIRTLAFLMILCAVTSVFAQSASQPGKVQGKITIDGKVFPLQSVYAGMYQSINYENTTVTYKVIFLSDQKLPDTLRQTSSESDAIESLRDFARTGNAHCIALRVDSDNNIIMEYLIYDDSMYQEGFAAPWTVVTMNKDLAKAKFSSTGKKAKYQYDAEFEVNVAPLKDAK